MTDALLFAIGFLAGPVIFWVPTIRTRMFPLRTERLAYGLTAATTLPWFGLYTAQMIAD